MMTEHDQGSPAVAQRAPFGAALREGLRATFFLPPQWHDVQATPALVAATVLLQAALVLLIERLYIAGPASFIWSALQSGWLGTLVAAWLCWWLGRETPPGGRDGGTLFIVLATQWLVYSLLIGVLFVPLARFGGYVAFAGHRLVQWIVWGGPLAWLAAAQAALLWRSGLGSAARRGGAALMLLLVFGFTQWVQPSQHWYAAPTPGVSDDEAGFRLTPEAIEEQQAIAAQRLDALAPSRKGRTDLYVLTFAPYADEDVFQRESAMVAAVLGERYDATARTLQLVNHRKTVGLWPWATPGNLRRAIQRIAERMDRDEDILFVHLSSHGARAGGLSASFWPLEVAEVTPQMLRSWLDDAGIRWRVISVSACYSGSWIAPLAEPGSMVLTAADAEHTSLGCGRGAELTYFGRAMYDEQMRQGQAFEPAHARAREVIDRREREAGKSDGGSNPQIAVGAAIRAPLARLETAATVARPAN